jgi:hypothetical protein
MRLLGFHKLVRHVDQVAKGMASNKGCSLRSS